MYPFSHVKSKRLLPLVGNPRHETQPIAAGLSGTQCKPREETRQNTHILRERESRTDAGLIRAS